jgi:hypothetical protein
MAVITARKHISTHQFHVAHNSSNKSTTRMKHGMRSCTHETVSMSELMSVWMLEWVSECVWLRKGCYGSSSHRRKQIQIHIQSILVTQDKPEALLSISLKHVPRKTAAARHVRVGVAVGVGVAVKQKGQQPQTAGVMGAPRVRTRAAAQNRIHVDNPCVVHAMQCQTFNTKSRCTYESAS